MTKCVNIFLKENLLNSINIEKIGMLFRPLTDTEKNSILFVYDKYFFSKQAKNVIRNVLDFKNSIVVDKRKFNAFKKYNDTQKYAAFTVELYQENNIPFNRNIIKKRLSKIVIVELTDEVTRYTDSDLDYILLSNIVKILLYMKGINDIKALKDKFICNPSFSIFSDDLTKKTSSIMNYISSDCSKIVEELDITQNDLEQLKNFINYLNVDRIRDFTTGIDSILTKSISIDNVLLNYVSCIERILVKYEKNERYDIGKQVFLKYGLCINDYDSINIEEYIKQLKYCYEIRSCIIHGNDNDLITAPQRILKMDKKFIEGFIKSDKYINNRFANIYLAITYLENTLDLLFKVWIENPSRIEFLKNN